MNEQELLDLKEQINEAKSKKSELKGRKDSLLQQLKDEFGCNTVKEAEKKQEDLEKELRETELKIEEKTADLEEEFEVCDE